MASLGDLRPRPRGSSLLEAVLVVVGWDDTRLVHAQRVRCADRAEAVDRNRGRGVDVDDLGLAAEGREAVLAVVLEERVVASAEYENVGRGGDPEAPRGVDRAVRIRVRRVDREGVGWRGVGLVVGRLGLDKTHVVVLGTDERVLVESGMFRS